MKEVDYIKATNRAKVSAALNILRDVLAGDDYGITGNELVKITRPLAEAERKLLSSYELEPDNPSNRGEGLRP